jgi:hypothetical protein
MLSSLAVSSMHQSCKRLPSVCIKCHEDHSICYIPSVMAMKHNVHNLLGRNRTCRLIRNSYLSWQYDKNWQGYNFYILESMNLMNYWSLVIFYRISFMSDNLFKRNDAVSETSMSFSYIMSYSSVEVYWCSGETLCPHLQGRSVSKKTASITRPDYTA